MPSPQIPRRPWAPDTDGHYEYRVLTIPRDHSTDTTRQILTDEAEYGRWELARSVRYVGGERRVWLRRRIMRVRSTLSEVH